MNFKAVSSEAAFFYCFRTGAVTMMLTVWVPVFENIVNKTGTSATA
jgi:hypothetical protein